MNEESSVKRLPHQLILQERQHLSLSGVENVDSFDETLIVLTTSMGELTIRGNGLHLEKSDTETGELILDGTISEFSYSDPPAPKNGRRFKHFFRP